METANPHGPLAALGKKNLLRMVALIPHADAGRVLEEYCSKLFSAGIAGAHSLPAIAPLAVVSGPFTKDELKKTAHALRGLSLKNGGKISAAGTALLPLPLLFGGDANFLGIALDLPWGEDVFLDNPKVVFRFPGPALFAALFGEGGAAEADKLPKAPELAFRAAMVANLTIRPLGTGENPFSLEWGISPPVWLPNTKAKTPH